MKAGNKAEKAIKNKYLKEYKHKKEQAARAQIQKEMNNFCEKKFGIPASQLPEQRTVIKKM